MFLCTDQYCTRYMVGTRGKGEVNSATNHIGFRCVLAPWGPPSLRINAKIDTSHEVDPHPFALLLVALAGQTAARRKSAFAERIKCKKGGLLNELNANDKNQPTSSH